MIFICRKLPLKTAFVQFGDMVQSVMERRKPTKIRGLTRSIISSPEKLTQVSCYKQREKQVTWGHGGPFPSVFVPEGLLATHLVAPCSGRKVMMECWSLTQFFYFPSSSTRKIISDIKKIDSPILYRILWDVSYSCDRTSSLFPVALM